MPMGRDARSRTSSAPITSGPRPVVPSVTLNSKCTRTGWRAGISVRQRSPALTYSRGLAVNSRARAFVWTRGCTARAPCYSIAPTADVLQTAAVFLLALVMLACHEPAGLHLGHVTYVARTV